MLRYACAVLCCTAYSCSHIMEAGGNLRPDQYQKAVFIAVILWGMSVLIMEAFHGH